MKHRSTRELFSYWNARRGSRLAPERSEIEPGALRGILADVFLLGREPGEQPRFRLAGTRVCALFGRELKDALFSDLWDAPSRAPVREAAAHMGEEAHAIVGAAAGATRAGDRIALELLLLPLLHRGSLTARAIGSLAPLGPPHWTAGDVLQDMTLGHIRYVDAAPVVLASRLAERRGLTVYLGSRR